MPSRPTHRTPTPSLQTPQRHLKRRCLMLTINDQLIRQLKLQDAVLKREAERSLYNYVRQAWSILEPEAPFMSNWHIEYVVEHLEAVTAGQITRLLINLPPRNMKSLLVSVLWPTWEWIHAPQRRWIFTSYAESLASKHSVDRRTIPSRPGISIAGAIGSDLPRTRTSSTNS